MTNHDIDFPTSRDWARYYDAEQGYDNELPEELDDVRVTADRAAIVGGVFTMNFFVDKGDANRDVYACKDQMRKLAIDWIYRNLYVRLDEIAFWILKEGAHQMIVCATCHIIDISEIASE